MNERQTHSIPNHGGPSMRRAFRNRGVAALLIAAATVFTLSLCDADAAPRCKANGATCQKDNSCCGGQCVRPMSNRKHVTGVCGVANGQSCSTDSECASAHCVDGTCCNTACTGSCFECSSGTCAAKAAGESCDDGLFCTAVDACDGAGACKGTGSTCPLAEQSEFCTICNEATDSCSQFEGLTCGLANGQACEASFQCNSNFCVDGVCCDTACNGYCEACVAAKTGYGDGTCSPVSANTDPDGECPDGLCVTGTCNGAGACGVIAWGTDPRDECPDGPCVTGLCDGAGGCGVLSDTTSCNDGVGCSQLDHCDGSGSCVSGSPNGCGNDATYGSPCSCNESTDTCTFEGVPCP